MSLHLTVHLEGLASWVPYRPASWVPCRLASWVPCRLVSWSGVAAAGGGELTGLVCTDEWPHHNGSQASPPSPASGPL